MVFSSTYTATEGVAANLQYVCAHCGAHAVASVVALGTAQSTSVYGLGGTAGDASYDAKYAAKANAYNSVQHSPCPQCGGYQPIVTSLFAAFNEKDAKAKKRALPIAASLAGLALLFGIVPALRDLRHSSALLITILSLAGALFGIIYALLRSPGHRPQIPGGQVHFWWTREDGSTGWLPPPNVSAPPLAAPSSGPRVAGIGGGFAALASLIALLVWASSFVNVYVVDSKERPVSIDDVDVTANANRAEIEDAHVRRFQVRKGTPHRVVIAGVTYPLPADGSEGWVVAPEAKENDLCFAELETVYGGSPQNVPRWKRLEPESGILVLEKQYDAFRTSPMTQAVEKGQTVRRWSLRALSCRRLEEKETNAVETSGQSL